MRPPHLHRTGALRAVVLLIAALLTPFVLAAPASAAPGDKRTIVELGQWAENSLTLPDGDVLVSAGDRVKRIEAGSGQVNDLATVAAPGGLALRGDTLYVASGAAPQNVVTRQAKIVAVDLRTGATRTVIDGLPFVNGLGILSDGSLVFTVTLDPISAGVYRTSPEHDRHWKVRGGITPNGLAVGPDDALYVGSTVAGTITRVDPSTGAASGVTGWIPLVDDLTFAPDGFLYAARNSGTVVRVDPRTGARSTLTTGVLGATSAKLRDAGHLVVTSIGGTVWSVEI